MRLFNPIIIAIIYHKQHHERGGLDTTSAPTPSAAPAAPTAATAPTAAAACTAAAEAATAAESATTAAAAAVSSSLATLAATSPTTVACRKAKGSDGSLSRMAKEGLREWPLGCQTRYPQRQVPGHRAQTKYSGCDQGARPQGSDEIPAAMPDPGRRIGSSRSDPVISVDNSWSQPVGHSRSYRSAAHGQSRSQSQSRSVTAVGPTPQIPVTKMTRSVTLVSPESIRAHHSENVPSPFNRTRSVP